MQKVEKLQRGFLKAGLCPALVCCLREGAMGTGDTGMWGYDSHVLG